MIEDPLYLLKKLKTRYLALRMIEILLFAVAGSVLAYGLVCIFSAEALVRVIIASLTGVAIFVTGFVRLRLHTLSDGRLISFINHNYPQMEESTDLLFNNSGDLTALQQIQKEKLRNRFPKMCHSITFPHKTREAAVFLALSLTVTFVMSFFSYDARVQRVIETEEVVTNGEVVGSASELKEVIVNITPPAYTRLRSSSTKDLHITFPAGSSVTWSLTFTDSAEYAYLIFSSGDSIPATGGNPFHIRGTFRESDLYHLLWKTATGEQKVSDYFRLEVIQDQPPKITVSRPPPAEITIHDKPSFQSESVLSDDYGLKDAYIVATVSKGSGESVKFREEKIPFTSPPRIKGRTATVARRVDVSELGLVPGDELYFYVEAVDNKTPAANRSRTETFFVVFRDTTSAPTFVEAGTGAYVMPEYFRSQRQIIIDTEKLLRERKTIAKQTFSSRSHELGYDQKVLRMKYGEFLGEEFETAIGGGAAHSEEHDHEAPDEGNEDLLKQYGHHHDKENGDNTLPEVSSEPGHKEVTDPEKEEKADPLQAYKHVHDDPEEATFFTQSIRSKLKAALASMWESELHLRTFQPEKSLPHQYKALTLLKEISNASRIYVHKTGFDPPPLKEEKRLTGDLSQIRSSRYIGQVKAEDTHPAVRHALAIVEAKLQLEEVSLSREDKEALVDAGYELAKVALQQPGRYLHALSRIRSLHQEELRGKEVYDGLRLIRQALWSMLAEKRTSPLKLPRGEHELDRVFIEILKSRNNE